MRYGKAFLVFLTILFCISLTGKAEHIYKLDLKTPVSINEDLMVREIAPGVLMAVHTFPWGANSLVIEMENSEIVLIDTPYTCDATKDLVEWIRGLAGDQAHLTVINTGFHFDNLGGNQYLAEQGIPVYGTSKTADMIRERGEKSGLWFLNSLTAPKDKRYRDAYKDLAYVPPTQVVDLPAGEEVQLCFGSQCLVLYYPGETHSPDNITVYYPDQKILFGGCMIKEWSAVNLGNTDDANLEQWPASIEKLQARYDETNVKIVVPGHGKTGDIRLLEKTLSLLNQ